MIAIDTETTGLDLYHGCLPYAVTVCRKEDDYEQLFWEWRIDPLTRRPLVPLSDLEDIYTVIEEEDELVLHNGKFDATALDALRQWIIAEGDQEGKRPGPKSILRTASFLGGGSDSPNWPWDKTQDTLISSHLLASNQPHDLTSLGLHYLGIDIQRYEDALEAATKDCRRKVQQARLKAKRGKAGATKKAQKLAEKGIFEEPSPYAKWRIAEEGLEEMPSAGGKEWKADGWLPLAYADAEGLAEDHPYRTALRDYANADSATTLFLWLGKDNRWHGMAKEMHRRGLYKLYEVRMQAPYLAHRMEKRGVTVIGPALREHRETYREESDHYGRVCKTIAVDYNFDLEVPKSRNNSLSEFIFDVLKLPVLKKANKGKGGPSLDKYVLEEYEKTLPARSKPLAFIKALRDKRARDTAITYLNAYERYWLPLSGIVNGWYVLHPNLNPTGTDTLRWSCNNPNEQNISEQSERGLVSLRACFGPSPGREWWKVDAQNLELRIPAYEAEEEDMIALFEQPDKPPFYGSNHLLNFSTVYPDIWQKELKVVGIEKVGPHCKSKYAATWYKRAKNGGFAVQYGSIDREGGGGTADIAFHRIGAHSLLKRRFQKIHGPGGLNERCITFAEKYGYVETIPDKSVDPDHGYPLLCTRTEWGRVLPTVPLNYRVQGTACWWMLMAMIRCQAKLDEWRKTGFDGHICMQIHDELVFDFPKSSTHPSKDASREKKDGKLLIRTSNLWRIRELQKLMAKGGDDIGVPTPVSCGYIESNWSEAVSL